MPASRAIGCRAETPGTGIRIHSSKGLQYQVGIIAGAGFLPWPPGTESGCAKLMYVAMTRATHELLITSSRNSAFSERLRGICGAKAA